MVIASNDYSIAVVERTFDLLEALAHADVSLGATDLARRVGTTKSAAYRILATLEQRGYVTKKTATAEYRLGNRIAYLGQRVLVAGDVRPYARPLTEDLHRRFRETINLGVRDDKEIVYIDMIESDHGLRMAARLGGRDHIHSTALGKAILAFLPDDVRDRVLCEPLAARTSRTITDPQTLKAELARIRREYVSEDLGENEAGARCFGAPIFDETGAVIAAISVSGPESRIDDGRAAEIKAAVKAAAQEITGKIGGRAPQFVAK